jgi:hypothetical protein
MERVRRTRASPVVESTPLRVRRSRPVPVEEEQRRVRRTRPVASGLDRHSGDPRQRFVIDWGKSLGWKLQIYLVSSYLYYEMSRSIITDHDFDRLCKELNEGWNTFEHQHKHCTSRGAMVAGTGYANTYPLMVRGAADVMLHTFYEV